MDAGFSKSLISKWKSKQEIVPSSEVLQKIADYFGVSVDYLLGKEKQPTEGELSDEEKAMLDLFRQAGDDARRLALLALEHGEQK
nr:MAG TPA: helix-turn-helix domain protein [Caudoviricetes sp.]